VISIRRSKLPDPKIIGNAGSFFKNPVVSEAELTRIKKDHPGVVANTFEGGYKLAAAWLIETAGWKGYRDGNVGCYDKQALVLVNYGGASGLEIFKLAEKIIRSVFEIFGIELVPEVNIL
jgi:UDP-N-acetylmuramate dehydrogenase